MARNKWFETVAIAQQRAKKRLPKSVYSSLISASEKGLTVSDNVEAFGELGFEPHVVGIQPDRELSTTVLGQEISLPVMISPTGVQAVDPDGEVAVARAAAARGTAMGLSSFASKPIEDVVAANPKTHFQIYWRAAATTSHSASSAPKTLELWVLSPPSIGASRMGVTGAAPPYPRR